MKKKLYISDASIGDLIFIRHKTKPIKTGWWRLLYTYDEFGAGANKLLFFEKPMCKDYTIDNPQLTKSRVYNDLYVMKITTISYHEGNNEYEILYIAKESDTIKLIQNNYMPTNDMFHHNQFYYSERGQELFKLWTQDTKDNDLEVLVESLIK